MLGGVIIGFSQTLSAAFVSVTYKDAITMTLLAVALCIKPSGILGRPQEENI